MRFINLSARINLLVKKIIVLAFCSTLLSAFIGCVKAKEPNDPREYLKQSNLYYNKAVNHYKELICKSNNPGL